MTPVRAREVGEGGGQGGSPGEAQGGRRLPRAAQGGGFPGRQRGRAAASPARAAPSKGRPRARTSGGDDLPKPLASWLAEAAEAYAADRYPDALRLLRKLVLRAPGSASARELLGLTYYRLGRWRLAVRELEVHHDISGSYDQYPVMADCYRALRQYGELEEAWAELRQVSPSGEVVAEGRLVAAGAMADRGDLDGAVRLLEPSLRRTKPKAYDIRQWYALADIYERAGELPRARELFARLASADPGAYDVSERLAALG